MYVDLCTRIGFVILRKFRVSVIGVAMSLGVVVIGRNEGQRLIDCLNSISGYQPLVYVDSGSTDDSRENAEARGATVVELDMSQPFSAARARNAGFERLTADNPGLEWVFFVDGDCQVVDGWLGQAVEFLQNHESTAVVCGRRKEVKPQASTFNYLCDMEWNTPIGPAQACGGDAMYRASVFAEIKGFDPELIAGEEPELCFRIRQSGHKVERLDADMTLHDAAMTKVSQWWKRTERSGHAYFLGWNKHGIVSEERYYAKDVKSILFWSLIPLAFIVAALVTLSWLPVLLLCVLWGAQIAKVYKRLPPHHEVYPTSVKLAYASSVMFGKFPQALGVFRAWWKKKQGKQATLVEYK